MKIDYPSVEFDAAVAAVCHGQASDEQVSALNELLRSNASARDDYILGVELHARLASEPDLFVSAVPEKEGLGLRDYLPKETFSGRKPKWFWAVAVAACFALVATAVWGVRQGIPAPATSKAVAMLNESANARWARLGRSPEVGAPLEPGVLKLEDGLAQIVFYSGTRVVIEGPAQIQLVSANHAVLSLGKITAEVPPQAQGFRIDTPQGKITDLGTSFGLEVREGREEVHVFKGEVQVETTFARTKDNLPQGAAVVIETSTRPRFIPANPTAFASLSDLQSKSLAAGARRLQQWRAAGKRLDGDSSLLVRFDFDDSASSAWQIQNVSQQSELAGNAVIVGCHRGQGRWPGKRALEFQSVSDRLRVDVKGEFESLTMATWVRVQGLDRKLNSLFMSDGFAAGSVHWLVRNDGVLGLTVVGAGPGKFQIAASPPVLTLDRFGMWLHLAVVLDGRAGRVVHYLNGRRVGENQVQIKPPYRIGTAELGNWNANGYPGREPFMIRNFSGAIDEFCLLNRALDDGGIATLYAEGRPDADPSVPLAVTADQVTTTSPYDPPKKALRSFLALFVAHFTSLGFAQDTLWKNDWKPSTANRIGEEFPRINSERRAQMRIKAPAALDVSVSIGKPLTVNKDNDGVWTITTSPLDVGFHFYRVLIDGANVADPASEIFCGGGGLSSAVEVPTGEDFHELKNVPHGEVSERRYYSKTTEDWRRIYVYTPPGYHQDIAARYPVLYLQHGGGEDERGWPVQGRVSAILDNLIAAGKARPMIIVMGRGYALKPGEEPFRFQPPREGEKRPPLDFKRIFGTLEEVFIHELVPLVDTTYRTKADRDHRAMAGLSWGGMQTRFIGLGHPETFSQFGIFSGGSIDPTDADQVAALKDKAKLVFVSYGSHELDRPNPLRSPGDPKADIEALKQAGINAVFYLSPETAHEWHTWRRSLHEFAPLLFQERAPLPSMAANQDAL